jgi:hypothetical protein
MIGKNSEPASSPPRAPMVSGTNRNAWLAISQFTRALISDSSNWISARIAR